MKVYKEIDRFDKFSKIFTQLNDPYQDELVVVLQSLLKTHTHMGKVVKEFEQNGKEHKKS